MPKYRGEWTIFLCSWQHMKFYELNQAKYYRSVLTSSIKNIKTLTQNWILIVFKTLFSYKKYNLCQHSTCQDSRHSLHMRCPQGSSFMFLSSVLQILHCSKVEPISQYISYCSCDTSMRLQPSELYSSSDDRSGLIELPSG